MRKGKFLEAICNQPGMAFFGQICAFAGTGARKSLKIKKEGFD
jgi:hypothetical protein